MAWHAAWRNWRWGAAAAALCFSAPMIMAEPSPHFQSIYSPTYSSGYNPAVGYSAYSYYSSGWTNWHKGAGANKSCSGWRRILCGDFSFTAEPEEAAAPEPDSVFGAS